MTDTVAQSLSAWQTFYFLVGGAAAGLVGLTFVAITLGSGTIDLSNMAGLRTFLNPTLIHFVYVLVTASVLAMPTVTRAELGVLLVVGGLVSAARALSGVPFMWHEYKRHIVDLHDWVWYLLVPLACYLAYVGTGIGLFRGYDLALNALACATVLLLIAGIRNTWDMVLWFMLFRSESPGRDQGST